MTNHAVAAQPISRCAAERPRIVAIGGGTGLPSILKGLRQQCGCTTSASACDCVTAIATVTDDGGSSGRLREQFGMLPPGDIRNCLAALASDDSPIAALMQHRFDGSGELRGHTVGNLLIAALTEMTGDFQAAIENLSRMLKVHGAVLPSTLESVTLRADFEGGEQLSGETAIVARRRPIKRLSLARPARPLPEALRALINADIVVVGPGSLYTSILPNLLVGGMASTLSGIGAVRIYVANLMTEPGETDGMSLEDHIRVIYEHVGFDLFDYILVNRRPVPAHVIHRYHAFGANPIVRTDDTARASAQLVERDLAWTIEGGRIRHAPRDVAAAILELGRSGRPERECATTAAAPVLCAHATPR